MFKVHISLSGSSTLLDARFSLVCKVAKPILRLGFVILDPYSCQVVDCLLPKPARLLVPCTYLFFSSRSLR